MDRSRHQQPKGGTEKMKKMLLLIAAAMLIAGCTSEFLQT